MLTLIKLTQKIENLVNKNITKLANNLEIAPNTKTKFINKHSKAPRMYIILEVHKQGIPLRPIVCTIDSSIHNLCNFLATLLMASITKHHITYKTVLNLLRE